MRASGRWRLSQQSPDSSASCTQSPGQERRSGLIRVSGAGSYSGFALPWGGGEVGPSRTARTSQCPVNLPAPGAELPFLPLSPAPWGWGQPKPVLSNPSGPFKQQKGGVTCLESSLSVFVPSFLSWAASGGFFVKQFWVNHCASG